MSAFEIGVDRQDWRPAVIGACRRRRCQQAGHHEETAAEPGERRARDLLHRQFLYQTVIAFGGERSVSAQTVRCHVSGAPSGT
jgi:hypothetical protein